MAAFASNAITSITNLNRGVLSLEHTHQLQFHNNKWKYLHSSSADYSFTSPLCLTSTTNYWMMQHIMCSRLAMSNYRSTVSTTCCIANYAQSKSYQHRKYTASWRIHNKPSIGGEEKYPEVSSEEKSANTECNNKHRNSDSDDTSTSPLNQRAAYEILKQLSSPPNVLTMSRLLATPYLSYLLISHHHEKSLSDASATSSASTLAAVVEGGGDDNIQSTISEIALDSTTMTASTTTDTISTMATNVDPSTPAIALSLFLLMGFTDFLDGYIARTFPSTATVLGTYLDPFADKFFISVLSLTMWYTNSLPGMLVGLWIARDVGIVGSVYWLVRKETVRKRNDDASTANNNHNVAVMDPTSTPLKVQASNLSKVNTTLQIGLIAMGIAGELPSVDIPPEVMTSLIWITAGTTIGSSLGYLDGSALKKSGNKQ